MIEELPIVAATLQAMVEHDAWLASIGTDSVIGINSEPHPWQGWGAPASEIAQALFHGQTRHRAWAELTLERGLVSFAQLEWTTWRSIMDELFPIAEQYDESASERARAVAELRRAERLGLIGRRLTHPRGGFTYWFASGLPDDEDAGDVVARLSVDYRRHLELIARTARDPIADLPHVHERHERAEISTVLVEETHPRHPATVPARPTERSSRCPSPPANA